MTSTQERPPTPVTPPVQPARGRTRPFPFDIYQSAVGKKWVMALSGIAFLGFLFAHMVGTTLYTIAISHLLLTTGRPESQVSSGSTAAARNTIAR